MSNIFGQWANDIDWNIVSSQGKRLSQAARRNLIAVSAICAISGTIGAGIGLVGNYEPRVQFCDRRTNPCTRVEVKLSQIPLDGTETKFIPGYGLQRTTASIFGLLLFGAGVLAVAKALEEAEEEEPQIQLDKQLELKRLELQANEELQNLEALSEIRAETHEQELREAQAELFFERNPHMVDQYLPKPEPAEPKPEPQANNIVQSESEPTEPEPEPLFFSVKLPENPDLGVQFWDWQWFNSRADEMPHIRVIGPTGSGKTTLTDWLADVVPHDERLVITVKRKPHQWVGLPVYGVPENYAIIRDKLEWLQSERIERTALMEKGIYRGRLSAIVDEWKAIARNVKAIKDPETKQITNPSAKEIMGEQLTLSRESLIRIFAMAQGRQVITWGLEGESDILECFCTVYLGQFAVEEAESQQRKYAKDSEEWAAWGKVIEFLRSLGKRAAWVECEFGKFPAIAPDLSKWKREIQFKGESLNLVEEIEPESMVISYEPLPNDQSRVPNPQSPDIDPDELLRQNLDLIISNFELRLIQSGGVKNEDFEGSQTEIVEPEEQPKPVEPQTQLQILAAEARETASEKRYTPSQLTKTEIIAIVSQMRSAGMSQTKIIEQLWKVTKSRSGWSTAYREFKDLGL